VSPSEIAQRIEIEERSAFPIDGFFFLNETSFSLVEVSFSRAADFFFPCISAHPPRSTFTIRVYLTSGRKKNPFYARGSLRWFSFSHIVLSVPKRMIKSRPEEIGERN